jgi:hypothetical protein
MQLDIFEDSRDTVLRNDVLSALEKRQTGNARQAWLLFKREYPHDETVPLLAVLIAALAPPPEAPWADHDALRAARLALSGEVEPAARRLFGDAAGAAWAQPLWLALAQRAVSLAFHPDCADEHAAPLWLRAQAWPEAAGAASRIESWRRIPAPLAWMAEARYRVSGLGVADAAPADAPHSACLLVELSWLAPARFDALSKRLGDPLLNRLRKRFDTDFEGEALGAGDPADLPWLAAWVLTERPDLAPLLSQAQASLQSPPERAMRLMLDLLSLERQGRHHDLVARRKLLRDAHASIYSAYMKTR